jgi:LysR family transcriptional regulator, regulator for bpeEF and oprC
MPLKDLLDYQLFIGIARTASFTEAARSVGISRASASERISALENALGAKLIARTTRKVRLTAEGAVLLAHAEQLVARLEATRSLFREQTPAGTVRVEVPERFANAVLIPRLPRFFEKHGAVTWILSGSARKADLVRDELDCVVRVGGARDSALRARRVGHLQLVCVASPAYLSLQDEPRTPSDLTRHRLLGFRSSLSDETHEWAFAGKARVKSLEKACVLTVTSTDGQIAAVCSGLGIAQIPHEAIRAELGSGRLREVLAPFRPPPIPVQVMFTERKLLAPRTRVVIDWLVEELHAFLSEAPAH